MNKYRSVINSSKPYNVDVLTSYLEDPFVWKDKEPASIKAEVTRKEDDAEDILVLKSYVHLGLQKLIFLSMRFWRAIFST